MGDPRKVPQVEDELQADQTLDSSPDVVMSSPWLFGREYKESPKPVRRASHGSLPVFKLIVQEKVTSERESERQFELYKQLRGTNSPTSITGFPYVRLCSNDEVLPSVKINSEITKWYPEFPSYSLAVKKIIRACLEYQLNPKKALHPYVLELVNELQEYKKNCEQALAIENEKAVNGEKCFLSFFAKFTQITGFDKKQKIKAAVSMMAILISHDEMSLIDTVKNDEQFMDSLIPFYDSRLREIVEKQKYKPLKHKFSDIFEMINSHEVYGKSLFRHVRGR